MKIVRTYINESIKPEANTFPFKIKYEGDVIRFIDRENNRIIYAYGRTTGNIVWYDFENHIDKSMNTLPRYFNIARHIYDNLSKAKEVILAHDKFKDDDKHLNIDESIKPVKSFKYKIINTLVGLRDAPFKFFRFVDWYNNDIIYYQYFPVTSRIRKTSGSGGVIGSDIKDLEHAKQYILKYEEQQKTNEALQPVKNTFPFKISKTVLGINNGLYYHFKEWDSQKILYGYGVKGKYVWFINREKEPGNHLERIKNVVNTLEEAKEIILNDWNKRQKVHEAIKPEPRTSIRSGDKIEFIDNDITYIGHVGIVYKDYCMIYVYEHPHWITKTIDIKKIKRIVNEALMPEPSYRYKVKHFHNYYKFYYWNKHPELNDELAYTYYYHTGWIFKIIPDHKPIVINEGKEIIDNIEKVKQFILDYEKEKYLREGLMPVPSNIIDFILTNQDSIDWNRTAEELDDFPFDKEQLEAMSYNDLKVWKSILINQLKIIGIDIKNNKD
jgi:hypothetical protein